MLPLATPSNKVIISNFYYRNSKSKSHSQVNGGITDNHSPTDSGIDTRDWDEINKGITIIFTALLLIFSIHEC